MGQIRSKSRIVAETPADANCFIGFHDIIPWSQDESTIVIHRANPEFVDLSSCDKPIDICLWHQQTGEIEVVDSTTAWNFQQGARLQWLPGHSDTIAFNAIEDGRPVAVLKNVKSGQRRVLSSPIYAFSPDGKISIAPNFTTLAHRWKAYGYPALVGNPIIKEQELDGLWQVNIETGKESLFISTKRVSEFHAVAKVEASRHFLCHVSFSPDGSRVAFLDRFFTADGGLFTRMIVTDREAKELTLVAQEGVSHFDWVDNDAILVWTRFAGGLASLRSSGILNRPFIKPLLTIARRFKGRWKKRLLAESYYKISVKDPKSRSPFGSPTLGLDGHPMVARSHGWIVTDFYPDKNSRMPVILYNAERSLRVDAQTFIHHSRSEDTDAKCDLHPRWSRSESRVAVDTCEEGYRQVRVLDVQDIVSA